MTIYVRICMYIYKNMAGVDEFEFVWRQYFGATG